MELRKVCDVRVICDVPTSHESPTSQSLRCSISNELSLKKRNFARYPAPLGAAVFPKTCVNRPKTCANGRCSCGGRRVIDEKFPIDAGQTLKGFLENSLKAYEQSNYVSFIAFDSTGMSAREQAEKFSSGVPSVGVYDKGVSPGANTKLRVGVCHKTVEGREYCLVVVVRAR